MAPTVLAVKERAAALQRRGTRSLIVSPGEKRERG